MKLYIVSARYPYEDKPAPRFCYITLAEAQGMVDHLRADRTISDVSLSVIAGEMHVVYADRGEPETLADLTPDQVEEMQAGDPAK